MFSDSILCYIKNSNIVAMDKHIWILPNQKPCITSEIKRLLKERNAALGLVIRQLTAQRKPT